MVANIKDDLVAGFSVFLIALPLCLGIAMASNFPPVAGVIAAIIGGLLGSWFGSAQLAIKGPAAGLIVISLAAVTDLGGGDLYLGYKRALAVGVIAALIQIIIALSKRASMAEIMPPSVIHGMLAAIGVIIVSKQLYVMMGVTPVESKPLLLLLGLPSALLKENPIVFFVGLISLSIVIFWPLLKRVSFIPSSIVVLCIVIPLSLVFHVSKEHDYAFLGHTYHLSQEYLLHLPKNFIHAICFPDFSIVFTWVSIKYIIMFALVGSIESLLTVCAIDSLAPKYAPSDLNNDLLALGIGNLVSSLIGGLPMISEIVRSKANIDYGAKSNKSNFFHGLFLLIAVILLPAVMNLIMLSALAALLVFVGFRLASPKEFVHAYKVGLDQLIIFLVTFFVTLFFDLLTGVAAGIVTKVIVHLFMFKSLRNFFKPIIRIRTKNNKAVIHVRGPLTFTNYLGLKNQIVELSNEGLEEIRINLGAIAFIDHTALTKLHTLKNEIPGVIVTVKQSQNLAIVYGQDKFSVRKAEEK